jgi:hypothetical protein
VRRPHHGPRPGFYFSTWADLSLVIACRSSGIDGCALLPTEQSRHSGQNPSAHQSLSSLPLPLSCAALQHQSDSRASDGRRMAASLRAPSPVCAPTDGWTHRRRAAPWWALPTRALTDPKVAAVLLLAMTTAGSSTSGRRSSRVHSGKRWLGIYPHGVWIRPQLTVVVAEISTPR